jgi:hypothetical protein
VTFAFHVTRQKGHSVAVQSVVELSHYENVLVNTYYRDLGFG